MRVLKMHALRTLELEQTSLTESEIYHANHVLLFLYMGLIDSKRNGKCRPSFVVRASEHLSCLIQKTDNSFLEATCLSIAEGLRTLAAGDDFALFLRNHLLPIRYLTDHFRKRRFYRHLLEHLDS